MVVNYQMALQSFSGFKKTIQNRTIVNMQTVNKSFHTCTQPTKEKNPNWRLWKQKNSDPAAPSSSSYQQQRKKARVCKIRPLCLPSLNHPKSAQFLHQKCCCLFTLTTFSASFSKFFVNAFSRFFI